MDVATRDRIGLRSPEDWRRLGYAGIPGACTNTLTYKIHPLFHGLQNMYPGLAPVLRLASAILESPASMAFLFTILYGHRERQDELSSQFNGECAVLRALRGPEATIRVMVSMALDKLTKFHEFRISTPPPNDSWEGITVRSGIVCCITEDGKQGLGSCTFIRTSFVTKLAQLRTEGGNKLEILNLKFRTAVTLVHELAHAINRAVDINAFPILNEIALTATASSRMYEPWYEDQRLAELGWAYENEVFGGIIGTLPGPGWDRPDSIDPSHPVFVHKWPGTETNEHPKRRGSKQSMTLYLVSMYFIHNIQQQSFWDYYSAHRDLSKLRIEKTIGVRIETQESDIDSTWDPEYSSEGMWPANENHLVYRDTLGGDETEYSPANASAAATLNATLEDLFERVNSPPQE